MPERSGESSTPTCGYAGLPTEPEWDMSLLPKVHEMLGGDAAVDALNEALERAGRRTGEWDSLVIG